MTLNTLARFLLLRKDAIETIAHSRGALFLGVLFVFGAALAREYDRSDLLAEPIHLFLPLLASLASSFLLWGVLKSIAEVKNSDLTGPSYAEFLRCFWMTAPLAWIYAIPVERLLDEGNSVEANFWMLGIVAALRVAVIVRVTHVLWGIPVWAAAAIVLTYCDAVVIAANFLSPIPVFDVMAGNRLSPAESRLFAIRFLAGVASFLLIPVLVAFSVGACWNPWPAMGRPKTPTTHVRSTLWALAVLLLLGGGWLLTIGQPSQQRATVVTHDIKTGRYQKALEFQSSHFPGDFPPHWNPPPYPGYRNEDIVPLARLVATIPELQVPDWVRDFWSRRLLRNFNAAYLADSVWQRLSAEELDRMLTVLESIPALEQESILRPHWEPNWTEGPNGGNWPLRKRFSEFFRALHAHRQSNGDSDSSQPADALQPESSKSAPQ